MAWEAVGTDDVRLGRAGRKHRGKLRWRADRIATGLPHPLAKHPRPDAFLVMRVAIFASAATAAVVALVVWVGGRPESTLDRIARTGAVRVGYANEPPYSYRAADGRVTGESAEISRAILAELGARRIEWIPVEFRALIPALEAGHFDVIAAGMFVTPERSSRIRFSTPTYESRAALLVRRGDEDRIASYVHLRGDSTARLAVLDGAYEVDLARAAGLPPDRVLVVPDLVAGVAALRTTRVDAMALNSIAVRRLADSIPGGAFHAVVLPDTTIGGLRAAGRGAFGFRKGDADFRDAFDARLRPFLGSARHRALVEPFGFGARDGGNGSVAR